MVVGKPAIGKSSLAYAFMGTHMAKVSLPGAIEIDITFRGKTKNVESYEFTHNGVKAVIWDTPGLGDTYLDQRSILRDISMVYSSIVLFLLYINAENTRILSNDSTCQMIKCLECKFSKDIWKKTLAVLVHADWYVDSLTKEKEKDIQSRFNQFKKSWEVILKERIGSSFLGVVPAGRITISKLLETDKDSWIPRFGRNALVVFLNQNELLC